MSFDPIEGIARAATEWSRGGASNIGGQTGEVEMGGRT
jgi:hypothetical protein